jgi:hypothetical protein
MYPQPYYDEVDNLANCVTSTLVSHKTGADEWTLTNQCNHTVHVFWGSSTADRQDAELPPVFAYQDAMVARRPSETNPALLHWAACPAEYTPFDKIRTVDWSPENTNPYVCVTGRVIVSTDKPVDYVDRYGIAPKRVTAPLH